MFKTGFHGLQGHKLTFFYLWETLIDKKRIHNAKNSFYQFKKTFLLHKILKVRNFGTKI